MFKLGFAQQWVDTIMSCVTSVSFCFRINEVTSDFFRPSRGLRQGDPLPPYLFLFCTQGLSALLLKGQREGRICWVRESQNGPRINHLLYADDSLMFIKNSTTEAQRLKEVLQVYELSSGQKVNTEKSFIYYSKGVGTNNTPHGAAEKQCNDPTSDPSTKIEFERKSCEKLTLGSLISNKNQQQFFSRTHKLLESLVSTK
ncbi:hypothetical protein V6N12_066998 [Hibiscus sabdariffa]|uniref:Reverse transcriptase domain-containing protein n=1 Tax=Hibiscus sabdariffa TaxID=183260 RepID=A0ABR2BKG8_9ROSI